MKHYSMHSSDARHVLCRVYSVRQRLFPDITTPKCHSDHVNQNSNDDDDSWERFETLNRRSLFKRRILLVVLSRDGAATSYAVTRNDVFSVLPGGWITKITACINDLKIIDNSGIFVPYTICARGEFLFTFIMFRLMTRGPREINSARSK